VTLELVEELGFLYDSSLMTDDYRPFRPRIGDRVSRDAPLERGREAQFWELPMCFELDDWVHFQFNFDPYRKGGAPPRHVREIWEGELDGIRDYGGAFILTMHPQIIGRPGRLPMLEAFIRHALDLGDVWVAPCREIAARLT